MSRKFFKKQPRKKAAFSDTQWLPLPHSGQRTTCNHHYIHHRGYVLQQERRTRRTRALRTCAVANQRATANRWRASASARTKTTRTLSSQFTAKAVQIFCSKLCLGSHASTFFPGSQGAYSPSRKPGCKLQLVLRTITNYSLGYFHGSRGFRKDLGIVLNCIFMIFFLLVVYKEKFRILS